MGFWFVPCCCDSRLPSQWVEPAILLLISVFIVCSTLRNIGIFVENIVLRLSEQSRQTKMFKHRFVHKLWINRFKSHRSTSNHRWQNYFFSKSLPFYTNNFRCFSLKISNIKCWHPGCTLGCSWKKKWIFDFFFFFYRATLLFGALGIKTNAYKILSLLMHI